MWVGAASPASHPLPARAYRLSRPRATPSTRSGFPGWYRACGLRDAAQEHAKRLWGMTAAGAFHRWLQIPRRSGSKQACSADYARRRRPSPRDEARTLLGHSPQRWSAAYAAGVCRLPPRIRSAGRYRNRRKADGARRRRRAAYGDAPTPATCACGPQPACLKMLLGWPRLPSSAMGKRL